MPALRVRVRTVGTAVLVGALVFAVAALASNARGGGAPSPSVPDRPFPELPAGFYHYTIESHFAPGAAVPGTPGTLLTERWVQIGDDGLAVRYLAVSRTEAGEMWQQQYFDGNAVYVGSWDRPGDGASCEMVGIPPPSGSSLPFASIAEFIAAGFELTDEPPGHVLDSLPSTAGALFLARRYPAGETGQSARVAFLAIDSETGQSLGDWTFIEQSEALLVLTHSSVLSEIKLVPDDAVPPMLRSGLPPCGSAPGPDFEGSRPGAVPLPATPGSSGGTE